MCGECSSKQTHNGLCGNCAAALRAELCQYQRSLAAGVWVDHRRLSITKAALEDYDTPQELAWKDRALAKLLYHNYDQAAWR